MSATDPTRLCEGFAAADEAAWRAAAIRALRGRAVESLVSVSEDGFAFGPLYSQSAPGTRSDGRGAGLPWQIVARIESAAGAAAMIDSEAAGGADGIALVFADSAVARGRGLAPDDPAAALALAKRAANAGLAVRLECGERSLALARDLLTDPRFPPDTAPVFDPLATLAATGRLTQPLDALMTGLLPDADRFTLVDGRPWHDGGATAAQELAAVIAGVIEWLRAAEAPGVEGRMKPVASLTFAAECDLFRAIAKLRAARRLYGFVLQAAGLPATPARIHVETSWRMLSRRDPHGNILRSATAAFAAALGGADSVAVLPHAGDDDARRLARNCQHLLIEEANLHRVADPAAGSGAVEALTAALAEAAWHEVRAIEAEGGLAAALRAGRLQAAIAAAAAARRAALVEGERVLIGVNAYADSDHAPLPPEPVPPRESGPAAERVTPLVAARLAAPLETTPDGIGADRPAPAGRSPIEPSPVPRSQA